MELNANQVAKLLAVTEGDVLAWAHAGQLPHLDVQDRMYFDRRAIFEWALTSGHRLDLGSVEENPERLSLAELFKLACFQYNVPGGNFAEVLHSALDVLMLPPEADKDLIYDLLISRERLMMTAIGDGLALPHLCVPLAANVHCPVFGVFFTAESIEMGALDRKPVHTLLLLLTRTPREHFGLLMRLALFLCNSEFVKLLSERAMPQTILDWISRHAQIDSDSK